MEAKKQRPYRPKDPNQLAKYILDLSIGEITEKESKSDKPTKKAKLTKDKS